METPTRKGGTLPLHGAHTAFSCYPALRLYRLSKSPRGIDVVSLTLGNSQEFAALMEAFPDDHVMHIPALLLYNTEMRIAKVADLRWQDIDLKKMTISVNKQIRYIAKDKKYCITPPKTRSSQRTFTITPELVKELTAWKVTKAAQELVHGKHYVYVYEEAYGTIRNMSKELPSGPLTRVDLVCTKSNGHSYSVDCMRKQLNAKGYNSHSFRHTHATLLVEAMASIKGVANRLGQSTTQLTEQVYTHATKKIFRSLCS